MRIKLDNAEKMQEYIKHHVGKAFNIPMLKTALEDSLRLLEKYAKDDHPEVRIKIS